MRMHSLQTNEFCVLDRGHSTQPWRSGSEAEAVEADADDAAAHFLVVVKLTNTNPTVSQSVSQLCKHTNANAINSTINANAINANPINANAINANAINAQAINAHAHFSDKRDPHPR